MSGILDSSGAGDSGSKGNSQMKDKLKKALALIANTASSGRVPQLNIGEPEKKEWKPATKEEAIAFELAKRQPKEKNDVKDFEQGIKRKIASGEGLTQNEASYANRFMRKAGDIEDFQAAGQSEGEQKVSTSGDSSTDKMGILGRIISAIKGKSNVSSQAGASTLPGAAMAQSAVQSLPNVTAAQKLSQLINSGSSAQNQESQGSFEKSPYQDYPDAFKESGVWKVVRNNKKYRLEE